MLDQISVNLSTSAHTGEKIIVVSLGSDTMIATVNAQNGDESRLSNMRYNGSVKNFTRLVGALDAIASESIRATNKAYIVECERVEYITIDQTPAPTPSEARPH